MSGGNAAIGGARVDESTFEVRGSTLTINFAADDSSGNFGVASMYLSSSTLSFVADANGVSKIWLSSPMSSWSVDDSMSLGSPLLLDLSQCKSTSNMVLIQCDGNGYASYNHTFSNYAEGAVITAGNGEKFKLTSLYDTATNTIPTDGSGDDLALVAMYLAGDANQDGTVNGADLTTVLSNYNKTDTIGPDGWAMGDCNGDGTVNGADLTTVLSNYNQHVSIGAAVPEPSTLLLAAAGLVGLLAYAWKKRK